MPVVVEKAPEILDPTFKPFVPRGANRELFLRRDRELVIEGPADTGKSRACLEKLHTAMTKYPGARGAMIRKTRNSLRTTAQVTYERWVRPEGASRLWGDSEYRYANGSVIYLLGMDDPERIKSMELDMAYVQEASELNEDDWEILTTRITGRGATMPYVQLLADMNPVDPGFWLYAREAAGNVFFLQARHEDNPSITPERIAALDALTGYRYARLRLGLRVAAIGMYFEEWDPTKHIIDEFDIPSEWTRWIAIDWGFADPFCALWFARNPANKRIYIYREIYAKGLREEQQAVLIKQKSDGERISQYVADPSMWNARTESNRPSIASIYHACGVPIQPAGNSRISGWQIVRRGLAGDEPRVQILRGRVPNLVRTLPAMVHDPLDSEDLADKVNGVKSEDHAVDPLRYGLVAEAQPVQRFVQRDFRVSA
jgi:PBSX family phage terminase large subunit